MGLLHVLLVSTRCPPARIRRRRSQIPAAGRALEPQLYDQSDCDHKTGAGLSGAPASKNIAHRRIRGENERQVKHGRGVMPFVQIQMLKEHAHKKDEMARRVADVVSEVAELPPDAVWVVFEYIEPEDWFVGPRSVTEIRSGKKK
jgi:4-oxalocrotonate tautomerase